MSKQKPIRWGPLYKELAADPRRHALNFGYFMGQIRGRALNELGVVSALVGAADALAAGVAMGQGDSMRRPIGVLVERVTELIVADDPRVEATREHVESAALASNAVFALADVAGQSVDISMVNRALELQRKWADGDDATRRRSAWAFLARGRSEGLTEALLVNPAKSPPDPDAQELRGAFNSATFLARCQVHGSAKELVELGWKNYLRQLPLLMATEPVRASWYELLWAARGVHTVALGRPAHELGNWLTQAVRAIALEDTAP